ncbi:MAG: glycerophosphodiester phosphodiesterase [Schleiferilactobacillus perolens]|uniref:glycerophosphodiester phosphodiesterase n=1 Tax=Schleiferilactobacillus perolens TaxID=100468 RepID=UPI0039E87D11
MLKHCVLKGLLLTAFLGIMLVGSGFMVIGHRGEYFNNHMGIVEHTYQSYDHAINDGASMLEIDLERSSDGVLVISHDPTTERLSGIHRVISDTPWATLRQLPYGNGERMKSLQEVLLHYRDLPQVQFMIETRLVNNQMRMEDTLAQLVASLGLQRRVVYESFSDSSLLRMQQLQPGARTLLLLHPNTWLTSDYIAAHRWTTSYGVWWPQLSGAAVNEVHAAGQQVFPWPMDNETGNEVADEYALGTDGVITNWSSHYRESPDPSRSLTDMVFDVDQPTTVYAGLGSNASSLRTLPRDTTWPASREMTVHDIRWYEIGKNEWVRASDGVLTSKLMLSHTAAMNNRPDLFALFASPFISLFKHTANHQYSVLAYQSGHLLPYEVSGSKSDS